MINNVVLVGRMTRDAELRYTPSNVAVATFSLAVNRNFKGANGERETDFINCVIWRQQAENLANWAKKGALIGITSSARRAPIALLTRVQAVAPKALTGMNSRVEVLRIMLEMASGSSPKCSTATKKRNHVPMVRK